MLEAIDLFVMQKCIDDGHDIHNMTVDLKEVMAGQCLDVSQAYNHNRHNHTNKYGTHRALTTSSILYSYDRDSVLVGRELLMIHGHSRTLSLPVDMPQSHITQLAGEGMALAMPGSSGLVFVLVQTIPRVKGSPVEPFWLSCTRLLVSA